MMGTRYSSQMPSSDPLAGHKPPRSRFEWLAKLHDKMKVFPAVNVPRVLLQRSNYSYDLSDFTEIFSNLSLSTLDSAISTASTSSIANLLASTASNPTFHPSNTPTFTLFLLLPVELQLKIWNEAARSPRIIHLIHANHHSDSQESHLDYTISLSSLKVPVVLHVCQNSRNEALTIYEKRTFQHSRTYRAYESYPVPPTGIESLEARFMDAAFKPSKEKEFPYVYFNPVSDVLLFGEGTCVGTMLSVFRLGQEIQRVAYFVGNGVYCCGGDIFRVPKGYEVINVFKALHGDTTEPAIHQGFKPNPGCLGLKEVMMVVKSKLWDPKTCEIDENVGWRLSRCTGVTTDEVEKYDALGSWIAHCKRGDSLWSMNHGAKEAWNRWTGDKLPAFNYVNFSPLDTENPTFPKVLDGMKISRYSMTRIRPLLTPDALMELEVQTGSQFFIMEQDDTTEECYEVGFWGTKSANEAAKIKIRELIKQIMQKDSKQLVDGRTCKRVPILGRFAC